MKCLLVDDEPGIREGLAALLRRKGHDVRTAADCGQAQAALVDDFDVVITDWRLPDGLAAQFVAHARCPVITVSGHPEEVTALPGIRHVMTKPVLPARLLEVMASCVAVPTAVAAPVLVADVQAVVEELLGQLPPHASVELLDDGTFVVVSAKAAAVAMPTIAVSGGDLQQWVRGEQACVELRLYRDGRPEAAMPIVRATTVWPAGGEFAVDFHDCKVSEPVFLQCLQQARAVHEGGRRVHFLNVSESLQAFAKSHGTTHDMPMRDAVGPRLQTVFADLWSQP